MLKKMLKKSKKFLELRKKVKKYINREVVDIILFGSFVKGRYNPADTDICIIFRDRADLELIKRVGSETEAHVSFLTIENFFTKPHALVGALLFEGVSLLTGKKLSEVYNLESWSIYNYELSKVSKKEKVKFVYAIRGRKAGEGLLKDWKGKYLTPGCFMVLSTSDAEVLEFLKSWRVPFERRRILLIH